MLKSNSCRDFQNDLICLGRLLQEMLEPESAFAERQALELLRPQDGDDSTADFLNQAHSEPATVLLQVSTETPVVGRAHFKIASIPSEVPRPKISRTVHKGN
jgi:hypothetical protein